MEFKILLAELATFFTKGSLITIGISNIASIVSNLLCEKSLAKKQKKGKAFSKDDEFETEESKEAKFITYFLVILLFLVLTYAAIIFIEMNLLILIVSVILYVINIFIIYKYNLFKETLEPDKYNLYLGDAIQNQVEINEVLKDDNIEEEFDL